MPKVPQVRTLSRSIAMAFIERVPLTFLTHLPAQGGAVGRKALLVQAAHLRRRVGPEPAVRLLDRVPTSALSVRGHVVRAQAFEDMGGLEAGLAAARMATTGSPLEVAAILVRLRIARALGAGNDVADCLELATQAKPRNAGEAQNLAKVFRSEDADLLEKFIASTRTWKYSVPVATEVQLETDLLLARGATEHEIAEAAMSALEPSPVGVQRAVATIASAQDWAALSALLSGRTVPREVSKEVSRYAQRALKAGWSREAAVIAESAIRSGTGMDTARSVHIRAMDQVFITKIGWPVEKVGERSYEPDPTSTLSVLAQSLPHRSGGYATRSHGILTGLRARGWSPQAVTRLGFPYDRWPVRSLEKVDDVDTIDGITYHRLLEPGERAYLTTPMSAYIERFTRRVMDQARAQRASLIHASSFQNNGLAGLAAARRLGIPFIYEMRGLEDLMKVSRNPDFANTAAYAYMITLENHIVANADLTFVITEALRQEMIRRGGPADRIEVLPNGVHTSDFEPRERDEALQEELGLSGRTIIGYAGGLVDYEGLELLVEAAAELKQRRSDFAVVVVGDGHIAGRLRRLVEALEVEDTVFFIGRVPHSEVPRYLSIFDITPFPRLPLPVCELISPIKPFEAMAMAKAVIASSVAALTEIVEADVRGLVFEKGDSEDFARQLERYLDSAELRQKFGEAAREWVLQERDWSDVVEVADAAYHRLTGS